jgi:hypothetical protein
MAKIGMILDLQVPLNPGYISQGQFSKSILNTSIKGEEGKYVKKLLIIFIILHFV